MLLVAAFITANAACSPEIIAALNEAFNCVSPATNKLFDSCVSEGFISYFKFSSFGNALVIRYCLI